MMDDACTLERFLQREHIESRLKGKNKNLPIRTIA